MILIGGGFRSMFFSITVPILTILGWCVVIIVQLSLVSHGVIVFGPTQGIVSGQEQYRQTIKLSQQQVSQ